MCGWTQTSISKTWQAAFRVEQRTPMRPSTSSWGANPRRIISRFGLQAEQTRISRYTSHRQTCRPFLLCLSVCSPPFNSSPILSILFYLATPPLDLELCHYQHHPWVINRADYACLGVDAVRLGPGQLWDYHPLKALLTAVPKRDTYHRLFLWGFLPPPSPF